MTDGCITFNGNRRHRDNIDSVRLRAGGGTTAVRLCHLHRIDIARTVIFCSQYFTERAVRHTRNLFTITVPCIGACAAVVHSGRCRHCHLTAHTQRVFLRSDRHRSYLRVVHNLNRIKALGHAARRVQ